MEQAPKTPSTEKNTTADNKDANQPDKDLAAELGIVGPVIPVDGVSLAVKHPLQHRWTMWYDCNQKKVNQSAWGDYLRKVVTVDTVEDFWGLYNNVLPASKLSSGANYHFFKEGIEPKWEDPVNEKGGKWVVTISAKQRFTQFDKMWLWMLLACVGEVFEDEAEICGCVASVRKGGDKVALWTRTANADAIQKRIGRQLKISLEIPAEQNIGYQSHADAMKRSSSFNNKSRYEV